MPAPWTIYKPAQPCAMFKKPCKYWPAGSATLVMLGLGPVSGRSSPNFWSDRPTLVLISYPMVIKTLVPIICLPKLRRLVILYLAGGASETWPIWVIGTNFSPILPFTSKPSTFECARSTAALASLLARARLILLHRKAKYGAAAAGLIFLFRPLLHNSVWP